MIKKILILISASFFIISGVFANQGGDDSFGYMWTDSRTVQPPYVSMNWIDALDGTPLNPIDGEIVYGPISLPFTFRFYGTDYDTIYISSNGFLSFDSFADPYQINVELSSAPLNTMIAPFWDDLSDNTAPYVLYKTTGISPNRQFVVMWNSAVIRDPDPDNLMTFELVLYETSNLIKFQYGYSREGAQGSYATIGIKSGSDNVQYSYNQAGSVNQNYAILFHPDNEGFANDGASAAISPTSVQASNNLRQFNYQVSNIFPSQTTGLGKIDRLAIANPFTSYTPTVIGIYINGDTAFIQNSSSPPVERGFATWHYRSDSLIIQTDYFEVIDSLKISFIQNLPTSLDSGNYTSRIDARLDSIGIQNTSANPSWTVTVIPALPHNFQKLSLEDPLIVGTQRNISVRLRDMYNNPIDGSTVTFTRTSSGNGYFVPTGNSTAQVVTSSGGVATVAYSASTQLSSSPDIIQVSIGSVNTTFTLPLIPDDADHFVIIPGSENPIEVGTERLLQVRLEDVFGNYLQDSLVNFTRFHGSGIFPNSGSNSISVTTGVNGLAEALYRASNSISYANDSIQVSFGSVLDTLVLPLLSGAVSYYEFSPAGPQITTAGVGINFTVTARDIYSNGVVNNDDLNLTASGSATAVFNPSSLLSFANDSTVNFTVTDNSVGNFTVVGVKAGSPGVTGQSGLITIEPDAAENLIYVSGNTNSLVPGNSRLLRVRVTDQYSNNLNNEDIRFILRSGNGTVNGNSDSVTVQSALNGIAEATLYTSTLVDTYEVTALIVNSREDSVNFTVITVPGAVSYYSFVPATDSTMQAGDSRSYIIYARDQFGNDVPNDGSINLSVVGSTTATLNRINPVSFGGEDTVQFRVSDQRVGSFTVRAVNTVDSQITGQSGLITIVPAAPDAIVKISGDGIGVVGTNRALRARLVDEFGNGISGEDLVFTRTYGSGTFSGLISTNGTTGPDGTAEVIYTLGTNISLSPEIIEVTYPGVLLQTYSIPLQTTVSYYEFSPAGPQITTAGVGINFTVTARDIYGNAVNNNDTIVFTAQGSSTAVFSPSSTRAFGGGSSVNVTVTDLQAPGAFTVIGVKQGASGVTGQSGTITVNVGTPGSLSAQDATTRNVTVNQNQTLTVLLQDVYGNPISGQNITFQRIQGTGLFTNEQPSILRQTGTNGIASAIYRTSQSVSAGPDIINVTFGVLPTLQYTFNLSPDSISYYTFVPQSGTYAAGANIILQVTGYDAFNNQATNSNRLVTLSSTAPGVNYLSANPTRLVNGTVSFTVNVTVSQSGVVFTVSDAFGKSANTQNFTITPAVLNYLTIYSGENRTGLIMSGRDSSITTDITLPLYAAGFDQYGNYIGDISDAAWSTTGNLVPAYTDLPGVSLFYRPTVSGRSGTITVRVPSQPGVTGDATGTISVSGGSASSLRITLTPGGEELGSRTFRAGDTLTLYASQFDASNNYLGVVNGDWTISPSTLGFFENGNNTITDDTVLFRTNKIGSGTIQLTFGSLEDYSGLLTVDLGPADSIVIRDQANGGGQPYREKTFTMSTDSSITLYAAIYDAMGNFRRDSAVTWSGVGLAGVPAEPASQIIYSPTQPGSGQIITTSPTLVNDATGTITVTNGALNYIVIQDASGPGGNTIGDLILSAGQSVTLYASGYDQDNNYLGDQLVTWSFIGSTLGTFAPNPGTSTTFQAQSVGNAVIRAVTGGGIVDVTGNIQVNAGTPSTIAIVAGNNQTGPVAQQLPVPLQILVQDAYSNPVPNITIQWLPTRGGTVTPGTSLTNAQGIAQTLWTLHDTTSVDEVIAYIAGVTTIPDTLYFSATPEPASGLILTALAPLSYSGQVLTQVGPYRVEIKDSLNNVVPNVRVGFAIVGRPAGSTGEDLTADTVFTNSQGIAETYLNLGNRLGTYTVRAFANATPSAVDFTGIANLPGDPDSIIILAGNNQTGIVGQPLAQNVQVRLVDAYLNVLPGYTILFEPLNGGSANPTAVVTNSSGEASSVWTLGTTTGAYNLQARLQGTGLVSDTLSATANHDVAANVTLLSIRGLPYDEVSALGNGTVPFSIGVTDQYGNPVPGQIVNTEIIQGPGAILSNETSITNGDGHIFNSAIIDNTLPLTILRSFIPGVDDALINIYRISYTAGSLSPAAAALGQDVAFSLQVNNPGPYAVSLNTSLSRINFSDGTNSYQAYLATGSNTIPANTSNFILNFESAIINPGFIPANYQPEITLRGAGIDANLNGSFLTGANDLRLYSVQIASVTKELPAGPTVRRSDTLIVQMAIQNNGNVRVAIDPALTTPTLSRAGLPVPVVFQKISGADTVEANSTEILRYQYAIPIDFTTGIYTLDGTFQGTVVLTGSTVQDNSANTTDSFEVISGAIVSYVANSLTPRQVNSSDSASFSLQILNSGQANVFLQTPGTYLTFGTDTYVLQGDQTLTSNAISALTFSRGLVQSVPNATPYLPTLYLSGQENGAVYLDTLSAIPDGITVYSIPVVQVQNFNIESGSVSQGQGNVTLTFDVNNLNNPPQPRDNVIINSPADIILHSQSLGSFNPILVSPLPAAFPITITPGTPTNFTYQLNFADDYPTGLDRLWAEVNYRDRNTSRLKVIEDSTTVGAFDEVVVLEKSNVIIASIYPVNSDTVSQGQPGVTLRMVVENTGQVNARLDSASLTFQNVHTFTTIPAFPITLNAGARDSFEFVITINQFAALGYDPIRGSVNYTNLLSLATATYNSPVLDSLYILAFNPSLISLNSVSIDRFYINRGQTGIPAQIRIINGGQSTIRIDDLNLTFSPEILNQTLISPTLPFTLSGGQQQIFTFTISVPALAAIGLDLVDAQMQYTELNSGSIFSISEAVNTDSVFIQIPAAFTISAIQIDQDTVSAGKTNLTVTYNVSNSGEASVRITQVQPQATPLPNEITFTRLSPSTLPTLLGGDTAAFVYRVDAGSTLGAFAMNFNITGVDQNDSRTIGPQASPTPANLIINQPGTIVVDSVVIIPQTVSIGQTNIPATVYIHNSGQMPVTVNNVHLLFNGSFSGFAQEPQGSMYFNLDGGQSTTREFLISVLESAPPTTVVDARATGIEQNLQTNLEALANLKDTLTVLGASRLRIYSVNSAYDSVSRGQSGISVQVRIRNNGGTTALLDTLQLRFSAGSYTNSSAIFLPSQPIPADSTFSYDFINITVDEGSALGLAAISARLAARDSVSNNRLTVENADTTHSWRVVTPGNLVYNALNPLQVTTNQQVSFQLTVQNTGQANMYLVPTVTTLNVGTLNIPLTDTTVIRGNTSRAISFPLTSIALAPGIYTPSLDYDYVENLALYTGRTLAISNNIVVQGEVNIDTISTSYPHLISQEMVLPINVNIRNAVGSAAALIDSVVIPQLNYQLPLGGVSLTGGANRLDNLQPYVSSAFSGPLNLTIQYFWRDANSGIAQITSFNLQPITVLVQAQLAVLDITGPGSVFAGQQDRELQVQIRNNGQATAIIDTLYLTHQIGLYTKTLLTTDTLIPGETTVVFTFSLDIDPNTATGVDNFGAVVQGRDSLSNNVIQAIGNNLHSWTIYQSLNAEILSVTSTRTTVSQGQQNVALIVRVRNNSNQTLNVDTLLLYSTNLPAANYAFIPPVITSGTISAGQTVAFNFTANISETALAGLDTIDARLLASSTVTSDTVRVLFSNTPHIWTVQERPTLATTSLQISPTRMSIGQDYTSLVVQVQHTSGASASAARLDSVWIVANNIPNDFNNFNILQISSLPITLQPGNLGTINFQIRPNPPSATPNTYQFSSIIFYTDVNSNLSYSDTSGILDNLIVEEPAELTFRPAIVNRYETHWGKMGDTLSITVVNTGQGAARITGNSLAVVTGTAYAQQNIQRILQTPNLPIILAGGDSINFQYRLNYPTSPGYNDDVQYQLNLVAEDVNSGFTLAGTSSSLSDTVIVLTPPQLTFVPGSLSPNRVDPLTNQTFSVDILNSGYTAVNLDSLTSIFTIQGTILSAHLVNPVIIAANDTTRLQFQTIFIDLPEGSYITQVDLNGNFHGELFNQTLVTGQLNVGGAINISSITFPGQQIIPTFLLGQENILIRMVINNFRPDTLQIDSANTTLAFRLAGGGQIDPSVFNLRRIDSQTFIPPPPENSATLEFLIDIPLTGLVLDEYWIQGFAQASDGINPPYITQTGLSEARFIIASDAQLSYINNSFDPVEAILGQTIQPRVQIGNSGRAEVRLNAVTSNLIIRNATDSISTFLDANYIITGEDTVVISFNPVQIPNNLPTGLYDIRLNLRGTLQTGDPFDTTLVANNQFTVLQPSELVLQNFDIQFVNVVRGQTGIPAVIQLQNIGESTAELITLNYRFRDTLNQNVDNQWVKTGSNLTIPQLINPGATIIFFDTLSVLSNATLGPIYAGLNYTYHDILRPSVDSTQTLDNLDTVTVITPGQIYIESTTITGLPNPPYVNTGQSLTVQTLIRNNGQETLQNIKVKLLLQEVPVDSAYIASLSGNSTSLVSFSRTAPGTSGLFTYRTNIDSVFSSLGEPIQPGQAIDNTESITVQTPALLRLTVNPDTIVISQTQQFNLVATVVNLGQAPIGSGQLRLTLPVGYSTSDNLIQNFSGAGSPVTWLIRGDSLTYGIGFDSLKVEFYQIPNDININSPAAIESGSDSVFVQTRVTAFGALEVTSISIISPSGAVDNTLSTEQSFVLESILSFNSNVDPIGREAQLVLPAGAGFAIQGQSILPLGSDIIDTVRWTVVAPTNVGAGNYDLTVVVRGVELNTNTPLADTLSHAVYLVERSRLALSGRVLEPFGARDLTVSTDQSFVLSYRIDNEGEAGTVGSSQVRVVLPEGFSFDPLPVVRQVDTLLVVTGDSAAIRVYTGQTAYPVPRNLSGTIISAAADENSNQASAVVVPVVQTPIGIVSQATLVLTMTNSSLPASPGQALTINATLQNGGVAGIEPGDSVWVRLDTSGTGFRFNNDTDRKRVRLVGGSAGLSWRVFASLAVGSYNLIGMVDDDVAYDQNKYSDSLVVRQVGSDTTVVNVVSGGAVAVTGVRLISPPGAVDDTISTSQSFTLEGSFSFVGSVNPLNRTARLVLPEGYSLSGSDVVTLGGGGVDTARWVVTAPNSVTTPSGVFSVQVSAFESPSGDPLADTLSHAVYLVERSRLALSGRVLEPFGARDLTVSTDQSFVLSYRIDNEGEAGTVGSSQVRVVLPEGFSFDPLPVVRQVDTLLVVTGDSAAIRVYTGQTAYPVPRNLSGTIISAAADENSNQASAVVVPVVQTPIGIVSQAALVLNTSTSTPIRSPGQEIRIDAFLQNVGMAGIEPGDSVWVRLDTTGTGFTFNNDTDLKRVRLVGGNNTFSWNLYSSNLIGEYNLRALIDDGVAYDQNKYPDSLVVRQKGSDTTAVTVVSGGVVVVDSIRIENPPGARDATLSTGQEFTVRGYFNFIGSVNPVGREAQILLPSGFSVSGPTTMQLNSTVTDTVWRVITSAVSGNYAFEILVRGRELNTGALLADTLQYNVQVFDRADLALSGKILDPPGARDFTISTNQSFTISYKVTNQGEVGTSGLSQIIVSLPVGQRLTFEPTNPARDRDTLYVATDDSVLATVYSLGQESLTAQNISANLVQAALDTNSNQAAQIIDPNEIIGVIIVREAELRFDITDVDTVVSQNQEFTLTAQLRNLGRAGIAPDGTVYVTFADSNSNFTVVSPDSARKRLPLQGQFATSNVSWRLRAPAALVGMDSVQIRIDDNRIYDENKYSGDPLLIAQAEDHQTIEIQQAGDFTVDSVWISAPAGATDDTLSTNQQFTINSRMIFNPTIRPDGRQARLILPVGGGFVLTQPDIQTVGTGTIEEVSWIVIAPQSVLRNTEGLGEAQIQSALIENLLSQNFNLIVQATAYETNTGAQLTRQNGLQVTVQNEARLLLSANITAPPGALDRIVSTHQQFRIAIEIANEGEAPTVGNSQVRISLPLGFSFTKAVVDTQRIVSIAEGESDTLVIFTDTVAHEPLTIRTRIIDPADDINSNTNATLLNNGVANIANIITVPRADLVMETQDAPPDSVDQNKTITLTTIIRNIGQAQVTQGSLWAGLQIGGNGLTLVGDSPRQVTLNTPITWTLISGSQYGVFPITVYIDTILSNLQDENNNYADTLVYISDSRENYAIQVINLTPVTIDTLYLTSRVSGPTQSLSVSTDQDEIYLNLEATFSPIYYQNRQASLILPAGVSLTDPDSLTKEVTAAGARWRLTAPPLPRSTFNIIVQVQATSPIHGMVSQRDTVQMTVYQRAVLSITSSIIDPPGARDDSVSYGQLFTLKTTIFNSGHVSTITGPGSIKLVADTLLYILSGSDSLKESTQSFALSNNRAELNWTIYAGETSQLARILSQMNNLKAEKRKIQQMQSVEEGGTIQSPAIAVLDAQLQQLNDQLQTLLTSSYLQAVFESIPNDIYTGLPADLDPTQGSAYHPVVIIPQAVFRVTSVAIQNMTTLNFMDTLSTNQTFRFIASVDASEQVEPARFAKIEFPSPYNSSVDGFRFAEIGAEKIFVGDSVSWDIQAPKYSLISAATRIDPIVITIRSFDENTGAELRHVYITNLILEREAVVGMELDITDPPSSTDRRLAKDQEFTLQATIKKSGDAGIVGTGSLALILNPNDGIQVVDGPAERSFAWPDSLLTWRLRTPDRLITSNMRVNFVIIPNDENTALPATLDVLTGVGSISISTEEKMLTVTRDNSVVPKSINLQGESDVPLLALIIDNSDAIDVDTVLVDSMNCQLVNNNTREIIENPATIINRLKIVHISQYQNLSKIQQLPQIFADVTLSSDLGGSFGVLFNQNILRMNPRTIDTLVVMADLNDLAPNSSFIFKVNSIFAYVGTRDNKVTVIDDKGTNFNLSTAGESEVVSVLTRNEEDKFFNYPNPFGARELETRFVFFMEGPGSAELKIYTLLGGLVYSEKRDNLNGPQVYDGLFSWDGMNNSGRRVLNGVYVAILKVNGKTYKTKVAYIK